MGGSATASAEFPSAAPETFFIGCMNVFPLKSVHTEQKQINKGRTRAFILYREKMRQQIAYQSFITLLIMAAAISAYSQSSTRKIEIDGQIVNQIIENGDTILTYDLDNITVSIPRVFNDQEEFRKYRRYRYYATKVYPYAVESIKIFREMEDETREMKKKHRKKYIRKLRQDVKEQFKDPLKGLTRTQGKILIKMIERELDTDMYALLKELNNGFSARKWQIVGGLYGYNLKEGYIEGQDNILDAVLQDFDISHKIH